MRRIREKAGVLKQLKRELRQAHKLSKTENGFPGIHWWHLKYWDIEGWVKKEELTLPTIVNMYKSRVAFHPPSTISFPITHHSFIMLQIPRSERLRELGRLCYCLKNIKHRSLRFQLGHLVFLLV